ncbi:prepilin-type N-terminal cleavage/methylation domain-containing protein [Psychromonas sp. RZ22]|uniref:prepilin-type N-terminal cleavage/methylation domain-containing protein n=1 Tax=Psychromonas algarum TaxID=2555643 RepID=UPI0010673A8F|nr:prepilin-type N-terminal cleavage/methylation domain-containing protein [Psychromonas sp. RZ22]TEW56681.1 prepilin-type N-terminal cleavage/methylation domain-containing protein [Psychromonas sp. RZ22]
MINQKGFTLIELVIVIIILGILAATAVPKFIDLQGDARASAMQGVKAALEGGATLTYSQAAIQGIEKVSSGEMTKSGVAVVFGYPASTSDGINNAVDLSVGDWTVVNAAPLTTITASGSNATNCEVQYTEAVAAGKRPIIKAIVTGC